MLVSSRSVPAGRTFEHAQRIAEFQDRRLALCVSLPDIRALCHGDYGFNNAFARDHKISGVIDWAESLCGDPLYDVAWLTFWSGDRTYLADYLRTPAGETFGAESPVERLECYELGIRLGALNFFAWSGQWTRFEETLAR